MLKKLLLIFVISITLWSCRTTYQLPADIEAPTLLNDSAVNEPVLIIQDIRWRIWANESRYICGEISKREYAKQKEKLFGILDLMSN